MNSPLREIKPKLQFSLRALLIMPAVVGIAIVAIPALSVVGIALTEVAAALGVIALARRSVSRSVKGDIIQGCIAIAAALIAGWFLAHALGTRVNGPSWMFVVYRLPFGTYYWQLLVGATTLLVLAMAGTWLSWHYDLPILWWFWLIIIVGALFFLLAYITKPSIRW